MTHTRELFSRNIERHINAGWIRRLQTEVGDLKRKLAAMRDERDGYLAEVVRLRAENAELRQAQKPQEAQGEAKFVEGVPKYGIAKNARPDA